ncbi:MAG TPA: DUF302 domain-containing protein [Actinomycetota bacterium]
MTPDSVARSEGIVTKPSPRSVGDTLARLIRLIQDRDLTLFTVIDHSGEAKKAGLEMPDTKLIVFGSPAAGTPVMLAVPLAALDLPLKVLVWADADGGVSISYNSPAYLASRHHLGDELRSRLEAIEALSEAAVKPDP